jgi:DNA polymerase-3 subunit alpha
MVLNRLLTIDEAKKELTRGLVLRVQLGRHGAEVIDTISRVLQRSPGPCVVYMHVLDPAGRRAQLCLGEQFKVDPGKLNVEELEMLLGNGAVLFTGRQ